MYDKLLKPRQSFGITMYFNQNMTIKVGTLYKKETLYFSSTKTEGGEGVCFDTVSSFPKTVLAQVCSIIPDIMGLTAGNI